MRIDGAVLTAIPGMAAVTYATRAGGLLVMSRINLSKRTEAWLQHIPGAVLVSIVAPVALSKGPAETLASVVTVLVMLRTRSLLLAMVIGVATVWALRNFLM